MDGPDGFKEDSSDSVEEDYSESPAVTMVERIRLASPPMAISGHEDTERSWLREGEGMLRVLLIH